MSRTVQVYLNFAKLHQDDNHKIQKREKNTETKILSLKIDEEMTRSVSMGIANLNREDTHYRSRIG